MVKDLSASAGASGDRSLSPGWGRSPGGRRGIPLQYSCLENPTDRGALWATTYGAGKSWTLSDLARAQARVLLEEALLGRGGGLSVHTSRDLTSSCGTS